MNINPGMIVPFLALILNTWLGLNLSEDELSGFAVVMLSIITFVGFKLNWFKK